MASRREEERNEKIIRGLMKLPPNRRCINCNSLGPQYVCINFWTFVCMTCSGIHREFTHRVKSVSMSKFTSQEVEALQNGGNQRAREIYLKDWDHQRQRLPSNSNPDKVREFIKNVYVNKTYAGGQTADKPSSDLQHLRSHADETRRASSYHSYSQSPPYDFQYEDRLYGKQGSALTRKPGSDRSLYVGKMSGFVCSPTRLSERMFEDRFANEGSISRISDYSVSSGGDPVRSGTQSPNFQKDVGFSSPPIQHSRYVLGEDARQTANLFSEANYKRDADRIQRPQKTDSLGSIGSFDSNSTSVKSFNSSSLVDVVSDPEQITGSHQDNMSTFPQSSASVSHGSLEHFKAPIVPESDSSLASPIDLFQLQATSLAQSVDLFQMSPLHPAPSVNLYQPSHSAMHSSLDLFGENAKQQSVATFDKGSSGSSIPKNEGWATFDSPQPAASTPGTGNITPPVIPTSVGISAKFDQVASLNTNMQWPSFQTSSADMASTVSVPWHDGFHNIQPPVKITSSQTWDAFDNSVAQPHVEGIEQSDGKHVTAYNPSTADYLGARVSEDSNKDELQSDASYGGLPGPVVLSDIAMGPSYSPSLHPLMEATQPHATNHSSTNPFDLPYDSDLEPGSTFLDMSSLQAALPNAHLPSTFLGATGPWFPQDPVTSYIPAAPQGGLAYVAGQAPSAQLANVQTQGPVASVGGNPFA